MKSIGSIKDETHTKLQKIRGDLQQNSTETVYFGDVLDFLIGQYFKYKRR